MLSTSQQDKQCRNIIRKWEDADNASDLLSQQQSQRAIALLDSTTQHFNELMMHYESEVLNMKNKGGSKYVIRRPNMHELGLLYNTLKHDEELFITSKKPGLNPAKFWTGAGVSGAFQDVWESDKDNDKGNNNERLLCVFCDDDDGVNLSLPPPSPSEEGYEKVVVRMPLSFALLKPDNYTIDAISTHTRFRSLHIASLLVQNCIDLARKQGVKRYVIKSLISSILFWRRLGFDVVPVSEMDMGMVKELEVIRSMFLWL